MPNIFIYNQITFIQRIKKNILNSHNNKKKKLKNISENILDSDKTKTIINFVTKKIAIYLTPSALTVKKTQKNTRFTPETITPFCQSDPKTVKRDDK